MYAETVQQFEKCIKERDVTEINNLLRKVQIMVMYGRDFKISPIIMLHLILNKLEKDSDLIESYEFYQYKCYPHVYHTIKLSTYKRRQL